MKVLFRVALVLLRGTLGGGDVGKRYPAMFETLEALRSLPPPLLREDFLVTQVGLAPRPGLGKARVTVLLLLSSE